MSIEHHARRALEETSQPRYVLLARDLANEIRLGSVSPGDRLPGERDLCKRHQLSRVTVRRALGVLRDEGLIEPIGARGWFVTPNLLGEPYVLMSFTDMARARGLRASAKTMKQVVRPATLDESEALNIAPAGEVFELQRLRLLDDAPVGLEHTRISLTLADGVQHGRYDDRSLYDSLRACGAIPTRADYDIRSVPATALEAARLECPANTPLLATRATTYDQRGRPLELSHSTFRGDRYRFRTTLLASRAVRTPLSVPFPDVEEENP